MTDARSPYGQALSELMDRLTTYAAVDLTHDRRAFAVFFEIASTPCLWPMDDILYELLLTAAGFDLTDADHLHGALRATALLVGGDPNYDGLYCGHGDSPSLLCALDSDMDPDAYCLEVMDLAQGGTFDAICFVRALRCEQYGIDDTGPHQLPDAA